MAVIQLLRSRLVRRTAVYAASSSFNALVAFLLLPVLTVYLSPNDYGVVEVFMTLVAMVTAITLYGGNTLVSKEYFRADTDREAYIGNILVVGLMIAAGLAVVSGVLMTTTSLLEWMNVSHSVVVLALCVGVANGVIQIHLVLCQLEKKAYHYALFLNSRTIYDISLSLLFIVVAGLAWQGRLAGAAAASFTYLLIAVWLIHKRRIALRYERKRTEQILQMGFPLMMAALTGWSVVMIDKLMINALIDTHSAGIYAVGYRFGMIVMLVETAFSMAWLPYFYENMNKGGSENEVRIVRTTLAYIVFLLFFAVSFGMLGKYLLYFMVDERFYAAGELIIWISLAYFLAGVWKTFAAYLIFKEKMRVYSSITFLSALLNIALNFVLLPRMGIVGAAISTLVSFLLGACLAVIIALRICPMPWRSVFGVPPVKKRGHEM